MPLYAASISEMITMPVGVLTADYIDVWCNTATDTPHKIRVGDMIAVKWNADVHDHEYTWCTVLATAHVASGAELTLMHEQAVDVPGHPDGEPHPRGGGRIWGDRKGGCPKRFVRGRLAAGWQLLGDRPDAQNQQTEQGKQSRGQSLH